MKKILLLGGTGYIANRIGPLLLTKGYHLKVSYRNRQNVTAIWVNHPNVELVFADTFNFESLENAFKDCLVIYYLVHSMEANRTVDLEKAELKSAKNTVEAALINNVHRLVYLGGLGDKNDDLSKHLQSRNKVGEYFHKSPLKTTILRAGIVLGSGSAAFEITRRLVTLLPIMITPKWVSTKTQPISIKNAIHYLAECIEVPEMENNIYDIGGKDIISYRDMMDAFAEYLNLNRTILSVPFFTPNLSSYWIRFVTGLPSSLARPLTNGMKNEVICHDNSIRELIPQNLDGFKEAIKLALDEWKFELTHDILKKQHENPFWNMPGDKSWTKGVFLKDHRYIVLQTSPEKIWHEVSRIGGKKGYFSGLWLWLIRSLISSAFGGKSINQQPKKLEKGISFDFWTILRVKKYKELLLWSEMKGPGNATLNFRIQRLNKNQTGLHLIVRYYPKSISGYLYWLAVYAPHAYVLPKMLQNIAKKLNVKVITGPEKI